MDSARRCLSHPPAALSNYPHATVLIEAVRGLAAFREPDALLRAHETINGWLGRLASSSVISIVSLAMFVLYDRYPARAVAPARRRRLWFQPGGRVTRVSDRGRIARRWRPS